MNGVNSSIMFFSCRAMSLVHGSLCERRSRSAIMPTRQIRVERYLILSCLPTDRSWSYLHVSESRRRKPLQATLSRSCRAKRTRYICGVCAITSPRMSLRRVPYSSHKIVRIITPLKIGFYVCGSDSRCLKLFFIQHQVPLRKWVSSCRWSELGQAWSRKWRRSRLRCYGSVSTRW